MYRGLIVAGFESPAVTKGDTAVAFAGRRWSFNAMKDSTVRTAGLLRAQKPAIFEKIREEMRGHSVEHTPKEDIVELPMPAWLPSGLSLNSWKRFVQFMPFKSFLRVTDPRKLHQW